MSFMTSYDKAVQNERYISDNYSFKLHSQETLLITRFAKFLEKESTSVSLITNQILGKCSIFTVSEFLSKLR